MKLCFAKPSILTFEADIDTVFSVYIVKCNHFRWMKISFILKLKFFTRNIIDFIKYYKIYKIYLEYSKFDLTRFSFLLIRCTRNSNSIYFALIATRFPSRPVSNDTNTIHDSASPSKTEFVLILSCQWVATSSPQKRDERLSSCLFNQDSTANVTVSLFPSLSSVTT